MTEFALKVLKQEILGLNSDYLAPSVS